MEIINYKLKIKNIYIKIKNIYIELKSHIYYMVAVQF